MYVTLMKAFKKLLLKTHWSGVNDSFSVDNIFIKPFTESTFYIEIAIDK